MTTGQNLKGSRDAYASTIFCFLTIFTVVMTLTFDVLTSKPNQSFTKYVHKFSIHRHKTDRQLNHHPMGCLAQLA